MKYLTIIIYLMLINFFSVYAQEIVVPDHIKCAGIDLHFTESLRKELQMDVNTLVQSQKYFNAKLERALQYFPIIEKILNEEQIPEDIKFLAIQESALIADAVSTSNAVGFWQFKEVTAREVGLRVDQNVDDRMNIITSTRGAAKYLKTNNLYFNNWIYAILAYNTGRGGSNQFVQKKYFGAKNMVLDKDTHWYIKKFLSHRIAFGNNISSKNSSLVSLQEYVDGGGKSLNQIADEFNVLPDELLLYNKWLKSNRIPNDRIYVVMIPQEEKHASLASSSSDNKSFENPAPNMSKYPLIRNISFGKSRVIKINNIPGVIGKSGEDIQELADLGEVRISQFLTNNDISIEHKIKEGQVYYFKQKHNKAKEYFHTVIPGETLWSISQKYGIKLKVLIAKNRFKDKKSINPGMVLWIRYIRPENEEIKYVQIPAIDVEAAKTIFNPVDENRFPDVPDKDDHLDKNELFQDRNNVSEPFDSTMYIQKKGQDQFIISDTTTAGHGGYIRQDSIIENRPLFHVVEIGETLYGLSRKYNIPVIRLMEINDLQENESIKIGQQIYLKEPGLGVETRVNKVENRSESYILYEVLKGDTMYGISKKFNVTIENIMVWNNKDSIQMKIGEKLKIYQRSR